MDLVCKRLFADCRSMHTFSRNSTSENEPCRCRTLDFFALSFVGRAGAHDLDERLPHACPPLFTPTFRQSTPCQDGEPFHLILAPRNLSQYSSPSACFKQQRTSQWCILPSAKTSKLRPHADGRAQERRDVQRTPRKLRQPYEPHHEGGLSNISRRRPLLEDGRGLRERHDGPLTFSYRTSYSSKPSTDQIY